MGWFNELKEKGFFDPGKNPEPIQIGDNYEIPSWEALDYLVTVASNFDKGKNIELVPDILNIVKNVSEQPVDNYRTWYRLIEILSFVPNDSIPLGFLDYIPVWVNSRFETMLQTMEILNKLLKKFLDDKTNDRSIEKAERILYHLFEIQYIENEKITFDSKIPYKSPFYLYYINHSLIELGLIDQVAELCSISPLIRLSDSINILLRNYPIVVQEDFNGNSYKFEILRILNVLNLEIKIQDENSPKIDIISKPDYIKNDNGWLDEELTTVFNKYHIPLEIYGTVYKKLKFNLENDLPSLMGYDGIKELENDRFHDTDVLSSFSYILREWLVRLNKQNKEALFVIVESFIVNQKFNLPFFRRMSLYIITEDWESLKSLFWKLIGSEDQNIIFSGYSYRLELYYLLQKIASEINEEEESKLWEIINAGPKGDRHYSQSKEEWQHRWLDALKDNDFFNTKFLEISNKGEFKEDYSEEGKITVRVGNIAPYSEVELLEMNDEELVKNVLSFKENKRWDGPTIEGLAENLGKMVEIDPDRFSNLLTSFEKARYLYVYYILNGFTNAWKNNKDFNWFNVLSFCQKYINSQSFLNNELYVEDDLRANRDWIYSNISSLISAGCQNEERSFSSDLLPLAKEIVINIAGRLRNVEIKVGTNPDFIFHCLNSTNGQVLQSLVNYALKYARTVSDSNIASRWDIEAKSIFENAIDDNIVDAFILLGMYLPQFMFIDESWLKSKIAVIGDQSEINWKAFMGGLGFRKPVNKEYFNLLFPCYKRAADSGIIDLHYHQGILRHFLAFYFWEFQEEFDQTFLFQSLKNSDVNLLKNMVILMNQQSKSITNEIPEERSRLEEKVFTIWKLINQKINNIVAKDELKLLEGIVYFTDFIESLDSENIGLVEENMKTFEFLVGQFHLLEALLRWSKNSDPELLGRLAGNLKINYIHDKNSLSMLVEFLYDNKQLEAANSIVNNLSMKGYDFLRPLYLKYN